MKNNTDVKMEVLPLTNPVSNPNTITQNGEDPNCNYIIPDVTNLNPCLLNNEGHSHKVDFSKNIAIVDFSYFVYCRFFAIRTWYYKAFPEKEIPNGYDWTKDVVFMEKFTNLLTKKLFILCNKKCIPKENIIYVLDCRHNNNWRVINDKDYKGTRLASHTRNKFHNFNIFDIVKRTTLVKLQNKYSNLVFYQKHLEADDLVGILCNYLTSNRNVLNFQGDINIIANDKDYIQLCQNKTHLFDLNGKPVSSLILDSDLSCTDFLIIKIMIGDPSDNIPCCYVSKDFIKTCGIKPPTRHYIKANFKLVKLLLNNKYGKSILHNFLMFCRQKNTRNISRLFMDITRGNQFIKNANAIDFQNIPDEYFTEVYNLYQTCFQ